MLKGSFSKLIAVVLSLLTVFSLFAIPSSAVSRQDEIKSEINKIEEDIKKINDEISKNNSDKKDKQQQKKLYDQKLSLVQAQINICNSEIRSINEKIAKNETEIVNKEKEMEVVIRDFKKRMSSIYMNGSTNSGIELLLGAEDFSSFLALSQLTANISRHDRKLMRDIEDMIKEINVRVEENKNLLESQKEIKVELDKKYSEYDKLADEVQAEIDDINSNTSSLNSDKEQLEKDLDAMESELYSILNPGEVYKGYFDGSFVWPVPGYFNVTSGYGERWGTLHKGMDIAQSGIRGKAVVASASGTVTKTYTSCPHNYGKSGSCYQGGSRCGGGYGNYVLISHGQSGSMYYQSRYAHLQSVVVKPGQKVNQGQVIGYVGSTGWSTAWHLHFEIHDSPNGKTFTPRDPEKYVKKTK